MDRTTKTHRIGSTLGAAIKLASQGQARLQIGAVMMIFSLGAALLLLGLAFCRTRR